MDRIYALLLLTVEKDFPALLFWNVPFKHSEVSPQWCLQDELRKPEAADALQLFLDPLWSNCVSISWSGLNKVVCVLRSAGGAKGYCPNKQRIGGSLETNPEGRKHKKKQRNMERDLQESFKLLGFFFSISVAHVYRLKQLIDHVISHVGKVFRNDSQKLHTSERSWAGCFPNPVTISQHPVTCHHLRYLRF